MKEYREMKGTWKTGRGLTMAAAWVGEARDTRWSRSLFKVKFPWTAVPQVLVVLLNIIFKRKPHMNQWKNPVMNQGVCSVLFCVLQGEKLHVQHIKLLTNGERKKIKKTLLAKQAPMCSHQNKACRLVMIMGYKPRKYKSTPPCTSAF